MRLASISLTSSSILEHERVWIVKNRCDHWNEGIEALNSPMCLRGWPVCRLLDQPCPLKFTRPRLLSSRLHSRRFFEKNEFLRASADSIRLDSIY